MTGWVFRELPARPMLRKDIHPARNGMDDLRDRIQSAIAAAPPDAVLNVRIFGKLQEGQFNLVSAANLRAMAPRTMNITVTPMDYRQSGPAHRRRFG